MPNLMHVIPRPGENTAAPIISIPPETYLSDDFERADTTAPDLSGGPVAWDATGGWRILNGNAVCNGSGSGLNGRALTDTGGHTDYRITATVLGTSTTTTQQGIRFREDTTGNRLWFRRAYRDGSWATELRQITVDSEGTETQTVLNTYAAGPVTQPASWDITVKGATLTLRFGTASATYTLPADSPAGNLVGMTANNSNGFADFAVYSH